MVFTGNEHAMQFSVLRCMHVYLCLLNLSGASHGIVVTPPTRLAGANCEPNDAIWIRMPHCSAPLLNLGQI